MSITHRSFGLTLALALAVSSACGSSDSSANTDSTAESTSVIEVSTTMEAEAPETTMPEASDESTTTAMAARPVGLGDLSTGEQLGPIGEDRVLWAVQNSQTGGCEGEPGWRIMPVAADSADNVLASDFVFPTLPSLWYSADGGVVLTASCEGQSWTILHATVAADGTFSSENDARPDGIDDATIQSVMWNDASQRLVFALVDGNGTRILVTNPVSGAAERDFILGDPSEGCSAEGLRIDLPTDPGLGSAARTTRDALAGAAAACDFAALGALTPANFLFSYDPGQRSPEWTWAMGEQVFGEPFTENLLRLLALESTSTIAGDETDAYGWPAVSVLPQAVWDAASREQLVALGLPESHVADIIDGGFYAGYRTMIAADGTWLSFIVGD